MGTKNNPGNFDCYANAKPDEPMFILLGRDANAPSLVDLWADARERDGELPAKIAEARACADAMRGWLIGLNQGKKERPVLSERHIWVAQIDHGACSSTFHITTVARDFVAAGKIAEALAADEDVFLPGAASIKSISYLGIISA